MDSKTGKLKRRRVKKIKVKKLSLFTSKMGKLPGQFNLKSLVKLNQNGSPDTSFNYSAVGSTIEVIAIQPDGRILIGGTLVDQNNQLRGAQRLQPNGAVDLTFDASATANGTVRALLVQPDGKILIGGFTSSRIARLNADGSRDASFTASAYNLIDDIAA